jgi:hypothetical protein
VNKYIICFLAGLFVGANLGFLIAAFCKVSRDENKN